jgi:hypothetical protein
MPLKTVDSFMEKCLVVSNKNRNFVPQIVFSLTTIE